MRKRTLIIGCSALAAAALAGGAYAATQSTSPALPVPIRAAERAFINDAARRLHVTPARLTAALEQALIDRIDAAAAAGRLPHKLAQVIKQRIAQGPGLPFGPGLLGLPLVHAQVSVGPPLPGGPPLLGGPLLLGSAAHYLGLSEIQLFKQLRANKSLADVARAHGKSVTGLERAMIAGFKAELAKAGHGSQPMPQKVQRQILATVTSRIQQIVNRTGLPGPPGAARIQVAPGGGPPAAIGWSMGLLGPPAVRFWVGPGG
jgi:hypothetical protein